MSFNLIDPGTVALVRPSTTPWPLRPSSRGCRVFRAELVGLVPAAVLEAVPPPRWPELDLSAGSGPSSGGRDRGVPEARVDAYGH